MRPYWTGTTEQSMPRAAPAVFPMPCHQSLDLADGDERGKWSRKARLQSKAI